MSLLKKKDVKKTEQEKVDERRKEVLSKGRKFKYPLQWTRHRVVINTILIVFVVIAMVVVGGWLALYRFNMTDDLLFRVTKVIPISVANVDGENVPFSDYLMFYRSSMTSIERQSGSQFDESSLKQLSTEYKKSALQESEKHAYAVKLAKELGIGVSDEEVDKEFQRHLNIGGVERSEESFNKIIETNFGLDREEYKRMLYLSLLKSKVEENIDTEANDIASKIDSLLKKNGYDYKAVGEELGDKVSYQETNGMVESKNIDGGRATEAMKLEPGQSSGKFVSMNGDGYYFVKLIEKNDTQVNFVSLKVPFTEFNRRFDKLRVDGLISEYITLATEEEDKQGQEQ